MCTTECRRNFRDTQHLVHLVWNTIMQQQSGGRFSCYLKDALSWKPLKLATMTASYTFVSSSTMPKNEIQYSLDLAVPALHGKPEIGLPP